MVSRASDLGGGGTAVTRGKGWHGNEKEQLWKLLLERRQGQPAEKDLEEEKYRRLGESLSSRPAVLFQQLNQVIRILVILSSTNTAANGEQHPSNKPTFLVVSLQRLSFCPPHNEVVKDQVSPIYFQVLGEV